MTRSTKILLLMFALSLLAVGAFACEMSFTLTEAAGNSRNVVPGDPVSLNLGETYSLLVSFTEDHGRCSVPAEATVFVLDEEKWKASEDHLPLRLLSDIAWEDTSSKSSEVELEFTAIRAGEWELEVLRTCDKKSGYDEYLVFSVR